MNTFLKISYIFFVFLILHSLFFIPAALAATLYFDVPAEVSVGSEFEITLFLDAEGESLNALEGTLLFSDKLKLVSIRDGDSIIPLWVTRPKQDGNTVVFSGIIPGGFDGIVEPFGFHLQPGRVFSMLFEAEDIGTALLSFANREVFRNTERAEPATVAAPPATFSVVPLGSTDILTSDNFSDERSPELFQIIVARDPDIFNGAYFIVFNAQDKESGIDYYEVYETDSELKNNTNIQWIKTESPYVLTDQTLSSFIYVKAVDKTGNIRIATLSPQQTLLQNSFIFVLLVVFIIGLLIFCLMVGLKLWRRKRTMAQ